MMFYTGWIWSGSGLDLWYKPESGFDPWKKNSDLDPQDKLDPDTTVKKIGKYPGSGLVKIMLEDKFDFRWILKRYSYFDWIRTFSNYGSGPYSGY